MILDYSLNTANFHKIISWLRQEWEDTGSGFYSNREIIRKAYEGKRILACIRENEPIGFLTWTEYKDKSKIYIDLDIIAIHQEFRGQGIGKEFYNLAEKYFIKRGVIVLKLFCSPASSESFWKAIGFQKYPDTGYAEPHLTYYKPLIGHNESISTLPPNRFELWNTENYKASDFDPKWRWDVERDFKSIVQPCNSDWKLRLVLNDEIVKEDKVKYFTSKYHELEIGSFLYINRKTLTKIRESL